MNCTLSKVLYFTAGAAIGSVVTWKLLKRKYEQWAQKEIDSVMDYCSAKQNEPAPEETDEQLAIQFDETSSEEPIEPTEGEKIQYEKYAQAYGNLAINEQKSDDDWPRVISPDEFGENPEYETVELTLYADGVLADDWDNVIDEDEIDEMIGKDSLNHFGEYEEDSVFVRNDGLKTDYQILQDLRNFSDVPRSKRSSLGGE